MLFRLKKNMAYPLLGGALILGAVVPVATFVNASTLPNVKLTEDATRYGSRINFHYDGDQQFTVLTKQGYLTDITLRSDEQITNVIAGDTARWMVQPIDVSHVPHVFIKPIEEGVNTNLLILTTKRIYRLMIWSDTGTYNSVVSFTYPIDPSVPPASAVTYKKSESMTPAQKEWFIIYGQYQKDINSDKHISIPYLEKTEKQFQHNYTLKTKGKLNPSVFPLAVFNDDVRTFIHMPLITSGNYPIFYTIDNKKKLSLVNYRVRDSYIIIDRLFDEGRLYYSPDDYVIIKKNLTNTLKKGGK